jgi:hypothetical protein
VPIINLVKVGCTLPHIQADSGPFSEHCRGLHHHAYYQPSLLAASNGDAIQVMCSAKST